MADSSAQSELHSGMRDRALAWVARLRSDQVSERDHQAFALWLAANPAHAEAMDSMLELWDDLGAVSQIPLTELQPQRLSHKVTRRRALGASMALAASICLAVLLAPQLATNTDQQQFVSKVGEQLNIELSDGTHILLNTNSRLQVDYQAMQRQVTLHRGEAFFDVTRDLERPFVVTAGSAEVRVLGTAFNVLMQRGQSEITVTEGVVRVTERNAPATRAAESALLYENQQVTADSSGLQDSTTVHSEHQLAWREGKLVAEEMPLAELVEQLSRYHERKILIVEPSVAQTTVSGVFRLEDPESILLALEHSIGVRSVTLNDGTVQLIKAPL